MATYGVTSEGFVTKPLTVISAEVDAGLRAILGDSAGTEADGTIPLESFAGQLKALLVDAISAQWDLQEANYAARDPNQAGGASQDALCALTGTLRDAAAYSTVTAACAGTTGTVLPVGRVATVTTTGSRFLSTAQATLAAADFWDGFTVEYEVGDVVANLTNIYVCITAGAPDSGGSGPTGTSTDITDGTVHWRYVGAGLGYANVEFRAESSGVVGCNAQALVTIGTPVSGWSGICNAEGAEVGRDLETDSALRIRRDQQLSAAGNTTRDAIRANILKVNEGSSDSNHQPPTACEVFVNDTDATDADGLPPHSIEILVQDGTDDDIAQAIFDSVGAGTAMYGNTSATVTDTEGNPQIVKWTRPTEVPIYVIATAYYDATLWPQGSQLVVAEAVKSALLTYTADYPIARDVRTSPLNAAMMRGPGETDSTGTRVVPASESAAAVVGLLEITPIYIGTSPSPASSTSITITRRQVATFSDANVTITATTETP